MFVSYDRFQGCCCGSLGSHTHAIGSTVPYNSDPSPLSQHSVCFRRLRMKQILALYVLKTLGGLGALVFFFMALRSLNELLLGFGSLVVAAVCYLAPPIGNGKTSIVGHSRLRTVIAIRRPRSSLTGTTFV